MKKELNIKEIEKKIGYTFKDKSLLLQAFTRTSFSNEHKVKGVKVYQSNEVLEFFGDSILSAAIVTLFVKGYAQRYEHGIKTRLAEGDFTVIRSKLTDKKNLSERARELGLGEYLRMGEGDAKLGIANEPSVLEDLLESIIGAVYIDSGMDMPRVIAVVEGMLDISKVISAKSADAPPSTRSAKNRLQEWCADKKRRLPAPIYKTVGESGPEHKKLYERACFIGDRLYAKGVGKNLKEADADAAEKTLVILAKEAGRVTKKEENSEDALAKLKEYAKSKKLSSPAFRDMGETEKSTPAVREFAVMCTFSGHEAIGVAEDKSSARALAAGRVLADIRKEVAKVKKTPPRVTKIKRKTRNKT